MRCPMVVVYKVNPITYILAKLLIKIEHIGMVNIVAGREVCPELIQAAASPAALCSALKPLIDDTPERNRMLHDLEEVVTAMGEGGASENAAAVVLKELRS